MSRVEQFAAILRNYEELLEACRQFIKFVELSEKVSREDHITYQVYAIDGARRAIANAEKLN